MESIKSSVRRALEFVKSIISPSRTLLDEPLSDEAPEAGDPVTSSSIEGLSLSPRVLNCLWRANIRDIEAVVSMSDENLLNIRGFGARALTELKERLTAYGGIGTGI